MPQTLATNDADCLSWPNTSREMFWASHGKHCFYGMNAFSLTGFEFQKFHHICILSFINFLSHLVSLMTLCIILSAAKDLFIFSRRSDWHFLWGPVGERGNGKSRPPPQIWNQRRWPLTFENEHFTTDWGPFVHNAFFLVSLLFSKTKPQTNRNSVNRKSEDRTCKFRFYQTVGKSCSPHMAVPCC